MVSAVRDIVSSHKNIQKVKETILLSFFCHGGRPLSNLREQTFCHLRDENWNTSLLLVPVKELLWLSWLRNAHYFWLGRDRFGFYACIKLSIVIQERGNRFLSLEVCSQLSLLRCSNPHREMAPFKCASAGSI